MQQNTVLHQLLTAPLNNLFQVYIAHTAGGNKKSFCIQSAQGVLLLVSIKDCTRFVHFNSTKYANKVFPRVSLRSMKYLCLNSKPTILRIRDSIFACDGACAVQLIASVELQPRRGCL